MNVSEAFYLRPTLPSSFRTMLESPQAVFDAVGASPVMITSSQEVLRVVREFDDVLAEYAIESRIFAAHKATSSRASIRSMQGVCGVDVASLGELKHVLEAGFRGHVIVASGPKNNSFLSMLVDAGATIALDSAEEAARLRDSLSPDQSCRCLVRLSRSLLNLPSISRGSRFGVDRAGLDEIESIIRDDARLQLIGVSFHIDTTSQPERVQAVGRTLDELFRLQEAGFDASIVDIGGGFGTDYGLSAAQIDALSVRMKHASRQGVLHEVTWQGYDYGLRRGSQLQGVDLASGASGAARLRAILAQEYRGQVIADSIAQNLVTLWLEPGASLFGASGVVAAEVIETRQLDGETVVIVDIHRNQLTFNDIESPADPVLLKRANSSRAQSGCAVTLLGHLCLESDILSYRKIWFDTLPCAGDVLVWTHMGAYASHFSASEAIGHPLARHMTIIQAETNYLLEEDT